MGKKSNTKLSGKEFSPLIVRRYSTPILHFVSIISDENLDNLDQIDRRFWEENYASNKDYSIQDMRKIAGKLNNEIASKYKKIEGSAVIVFADKLAVSSLYGDFMNHNSCKQELLSLVNIMTKV